MNASPLARISRHQAPETPNRIAFFSPQHLITYRDLNRRADQIARGLWASGIYGGRKVASLMKCRPELIELSIGCMRAGAVLVPMAPATSADELLSVLKVCRPRAVFIDSESVEHLEHIRLQLYFIDLIVTSGPHFQKWRSEQAEGSPDASPHIGDTVMQVYTRDSQGDLSPRKVSLEDLLGDFLIFDEEYGGQEPQSSEPQEIVRILPDVDPFHNLLLGLSSLARGAQVIFDA